MPLNFYKTKILLFLLGWGLTCPFHLYGQMEIEGVINYSLKDGLSDRAVLDIVQDNDGFIWISTNNGLNRFDGYDFMVFDNNENTKYQISQSRIHDMEILDGGKIGLINEDNFSFFEIFDPQTFQGERIELNAEIGLQGTCVALFMEKGNGVYVLTVADKGYRVFYHDGKRAMRQVARLEVEFEPDLEKVFFLKGTSGHYWIFDDKNGLIKIDGQGALVHHWPMNLLLTHTTPTAVNYETGLMHEDQGGALWLAIPFRQGLLTIAEGQTEISYPPNLPQNETYFKIWEDHLGRLNIGTFLAYWKIKQLFQVGKDGTVQSLQDLVKIETTIGTLFKPAKENVLFLGTFVGVFKVDLMDRKVKWLLAERQLEDNQWDDGISIRGITGGLGDKVFISRELSAWYHTDEALAPAQEIILRDEHLVT